MIVINTVSDNYFTLNGTQYAKIFHPFKQGVNAVGIYNVNDTKQQLLNSTNYTEYSINSTSYGSADDVIVALLPVIYKAYNSGEDDTNSTWGNITGNIQTQSDLIALLNNKADVNDVSVVGFTNNYNDLDNLPTLSGTSYSAGAGLTLSGDTFLHNDTGDFSATTLSDATIVSNLTIDEFGHLEGWVTRELTPTDIGASSTGHSHTFFEEDVFGNSQIELTASGVISIDFSANSMVYVNQVSGITLSITEPTLTIGEKVTRLIYIKSNGNSITIPSTLNDEMVGSLDINKKNWIAISYIRIDGSTIIQFSNCTNL